MFIAFSYSALKTLLHCFPSYMASNEVFAAILSLIPLLNILICIVVFLAAFNIFSLSLVLSNLTMCCGLVSSGFLCLGFAKSLDLWVYIFLQIWKYFSGYFFIILSIHPTLYSCLWGPQLHIYSAN